MLLTHAHLDHSGYLPLLVKNGFRGPIISTAATEDLCRVLLPDSGHLQEQDAEFANRHGFSKHKPALPLYTEEDANRALKAFHAIEFGEDVHLPAGGVAHFVPAGHILGAASIALDWKGIRIVFSDVSAMIERLNILSGQRQISATSRTRLNDEMDALAGIINKTIHRGGTVIVPAFAVGRAQSLIYHIGQLEELTKSYTMVSERSVHQRVTRKSKPESASESQVSAAKREPEPVTQPSAGQDLGDNIELF